MKLKSTARLYAIYGAAAVVAGLTLGIKNRLNRVDTYCVNEPNAIISDACASYKDVEQLNKGLRPLILKLTQNTDYFGYYRLNLYGRECPFWSDDGGFCGNRACAVDVLTDEEDIPEIWRAAELGKLAGPRVTQPYESVAEEEPSPLGGALGPDTSETCVFENDEFDDRDYCLPEDERAEADVVYVSLVDNPEKFTGYTGGHGAHSIWNAIYSENCFVKSTQEQTKSPVSQFPFGKAGGHSFGNAESDLRNVMLERPKLAMGQFKQANPLLFDDECVEKRVFHRIISGMHASISMHLCHEYLDQRTGQWGPNLTCYVDRLQNHPDRLQNIYFNYALVLRAIAKLRSHLPMYTFCSGDAKQNAATKSLVQELSDRAAGENTLVFDESVMFADEESFRLKDDFRNQFRNISRLMDCVGCDKCRLWGKVQTTGLGTALKILFEFEEDPVDDDDVQMLRRTEMVSLVNTLDRLSNSLHYAQQFSRMFDRHTNYKNKLDALKQSESEAEPASQTREYNEDATVKEMFWEEFEQVFTAFKWVMTTWYDMPYKIYYVFMYHTTVLWDRFVGRDIYVERAKPYRFQSEL